MHHSLVTANNVYVSCLAENGLFPATLMPA